MGDSGVLHDATALLRNQYSLSYSPSSGAKDGKFHKVRVELVAPDGGPLTIVDQKGKNKKVWSTPAKVIRPPKTASATNRMEI